MIPTRLVGIGVCLTLLTVALSRHTLANQTEYASTEASINQTSIKQVGKARILLESNSFDLAEPSGGLAKNESSTSEGARKPNRKRKRKERENRRLSNIWSLFLPGSGSPQEADYEDEEASKSGADSSSDSAAVVDQAPSSNVVTQEQPEAAKVNRTTEISKERHDERIVAKYSRPPRQDSSSEPLMASGSTGGLAMRSPAETNASSAQYASPAPSNEPVQLITGALSQDMSLNMDLASSGARGETEREGDQSQIQARANATSSTKLEGSNFERWLNKIQFKEPAPTKTTTAKPVTESSGLQSKQENKARPAQPMSQQDLARMVEMLQELRTRQQQQQRNKVQRVRAPSSGSGKPTEQAAPANRLAGLARQSAQQQQRRHHNSQLIYGIKQPVAQASSIAVSTQDGSSNTSLSFSMLNQMQAGAEMSQVENSTSSAGSSSTSQLASSSGGRRDESGQVEQSVYQSQDEILRQVTSAINFEQQLAQNGRDPIKLDNHRKSGDGSPSPSSPSEEPASDNIAKLFKSGSSINELLDQQTGKSNSSNNLLGTEDVDKSFDPLAEKLRQLAIQQQQVPLNLTGSNQPLWLLRKPLMSSSALLDNATNLTKLTASSTSKDTATTPSSNLDKLNELLNKLEKSKNELKSSQESMALLMQQFAQQQQQLKSSDNNNLQDEKVDHEQKTEAEAHLDNNGANESGRQQELPGWMPMNKPAFNQANLMSPGNLLKNRVRQMPMKSQPMQDNPNQSDDYHMNMMFASSPVEQPGVDQEQNNQVTIDQQVSQRIIGLPIAIMKEDELELNSAHFDTASLQAAAAAAAEQLSDSTGRGPAKFNPRLAPNNNNRNVYPNQPSQLNQIQKILQNYSPQTFSSGHAVTPRAPFVGEPHPSNQQVLSQQHELAMNPEQMASLLPTNERVESNQFKAAMIGKDTERQGNQLQMMQEQGAQLLAENPTANNSPPAPPRKEPNEQRSPLAMQGQFQYQPDEFRLQKQAQQQQPPQSAPAPPHMLNRQPVSAFVQTTSSIEYPMRPGLVHQYELAPPPQPPFMQPLITTTSITSEGPPVRIREISLPRPFGFRGNHAIAYQPSSTVAAIFPRLMGQSQPRPSLLRHMTPIRAGIGESQRLLRPLFNAYDENRPQMLHQRFYGNPGLGSLPFQPIHHSYAQRFSSGIHERKGHPSRGLKRLMLGSASHPVENWRLNKLNQPTAYASPKTMRAIHQAEQEHLDSFELPVDDTELLSIDDDTSAFNDDTKYLPMESLRETSIRDLDGEIRHGGARKFAPPITQMRLGKRPPMGESRPTRERPLRASSLTRAKSGSPNCNHIALPVDKPSNWPNQVDKAQSRATVSTRSPPPPVVSTSTEAIPLKSTEIMPTIPQSAGQKSTTVEPKVEVLTKAEV